MALGSFLKDKLKSLASGSNSIMAGDPYDGEVETRDKQLRALRRSRRRQLDVVEKRELRRAINDFRRREDSRAFLGESPLGGRLKRVKKRLPAVRDESYSFLGRSKGMFKGGLL